MATIKASVGKILYGALFTLLLPFLLLLWASASDRQVGLPVVYEPLWGLALAAVGCGLIIAGMYALRRYGKGLPMNAFPPEHFVAIGIYRYLSHPIYVGFCVLCFGVASAAGSPAGLWLVAPIATLGSVALVLGYEREDLRRRFGEVVSKPLIHISPDADTIPTFWHRLSVYLLLLLPWLILYQGIVLLGVPHDAIELYLPFEKELPVIEWTEILYLSAYPLVLLAPLVATRARDLRWFLRAGWISTGVIMLIYVVLPVVATPRPFESTTLLGDLLLLERGFDSPAAAFPSFHVVWALLAAGLLIRSRPSLRLVWWGWSWGIVLSCITTGMHSLADVVAGILFYLSVRRHEQIAELLRASAERIANSWREWHLGPLRIINHGLYAGGGTFLGLTLTGALVGAEHAVDMLIVGICSLVGAGIWAQLVEGSSSLLRPFGYYGGIIGGTVGCVVAGLRGGDIWLLLAGFSVGTTVIQSFGRLRCLVQGCCHGRESSEVIGIRYTHPRSRVCRLSGLAGRPLHPTQLYSILWNLVLMSVLLRLWMGGTPLTMITGLYLILTGLGRFVEEGYRGEPQTVVVAGLRLYQWIALSTVVAGAVLTTIQSNLTPHPEFILPTAAVAGLLGLVTTIAMGVDVPGSNRRFSRLV